jgi:DNA-binding transcriptional LysR family regulator
LLPNVLGRFASRNADVVLEAAIGTSGDVLAWLKADRIQFGLVEAPLQDRDVELEPIGQDELLLVAPASHQLTRHGPLAAVSLTRYPILRRESTSGTQQLVDTELRRHAAYSPTQSVLGSTEALKQAVVAGVGIAWLPRLAVMRELSRGELSRVQVEDLEICRTLSLVRLRGSDLSPAAATLIGELRSALEIHKPG